MSLSQEDIHREYGQKLRVRVCGLLLKDDHLLLVRHRSLGENGTLWAPPGGGLHYGESVVDALKREFLEETGLTISVGSHLFTHEFLEPPLHAIELFFEVTHKSGELKIGHDPEMEQDKQVIMETKFTSLEELNTLKKTDLHHILRRVKDWTALFQPKTSFLYK